jgi:hypothetical protein
MITSLWLSLWEASVTRAISPEPTSTRALRSYNRSGSDVFVSASMLAAT